MGKPSPIPIMLAAGLVLAVSSGKKASPKLAPAPKPGGGSSGGGAPMPQPAPVAPAIPETAQCSFQIELQGPNGEILTHPSGELAVAHILNGPKSSAKEAEGIARAQFISGPPGSRWVLIGVCDVDGELVRYPAAVIKTIPAEDE